METSAARAAALRINGVEPDLVVYVPGRPVGYERVAVDGRTGRRFTQKRTSDYMSMIYSVVTCARRGRPIFPLAEWVFVDIWIRTSGKSWPDADNVVKSVCDGSAGVLWTAGSKGARDDRYVLPRVQGYETGCKIPEEGVVIAVTRLSQITWES